MNVLNWLRDRMWPSPDTPFDAKQHEEDMQTEISGLIAEANRIAKDEDKETRLKELHDALRENCDSESERRKSIDTRLNTLAGLAAAGAALLSSTAASKVQQFSSVTNIAIPIVITYILVQLCAAAWHAIRGLSAAESDKPMVKDLLRRDRDYNAFAKLLVEEYIRCRYSLIRVCDGKITRMNCAYEALINVVFAACIGGVLLAARVVTAESGEETSDLILTKLRSDPELIRLLTGPQGTRGEAGPSGPPGLPGRDGKDACCEIQDTKSSPWWNDHLGRTCALCAPSTPATP